MARIIGRGGANVLLELEADSGELFRVYYRECKLSSNNAFTIENYNYICDVMNPLLGDLLCPMELVVLKCDFTISKVLSSLDVIVDAPNLVTLKLPRLIDDRVHDTILRSRYLVVHISAKQLVLECKPKWLTKSPGLCRNCAQNKLRDRFGQDDLCYVKLMHDPQLWETLIPESAPLRLRHKSLAYFSQSNVLHKLKYLQEQHVPQDMSTVTSEVEITDETLLAMTLRDVTIFITFTLDDCMTKIVDVDLKSRKKWTHWKETQLLLNDQIPADSH